MKTNTYVYDPLTDESDCLENNAEIIFILRPNKHIRARVEKGKLRLYSPNGTAYISADVPGILFHAEIEDY